MAVIRTLSPHVADLIAAGEVVERPASVVKELLENAVDAGAKTVTVEIQHGGVTFIRVTDDGCGMAPDDAETAFLRHATSKIRSEEDLGQIGTMGFRGEALAAISSVTRIELMTRTAGSTAGTSLRLEAGVVTERSEVGCPVGTTIVVRDLFYNTPARMKFLKRDSVEGSAVTACVQKQALAHPEVSIRLIRDGQEAIRTAGDGDLRGAIYAVLGRATALEMVPVSSGWEKLKLTGFVTKPTATRGNRAHPMFYVNNRPVVSKLLISAFEQAYANQLMQGRFPGCVLHLSVPAEAVDVNVHPAKTEVKFLSEQDVFDCVRYGVQAALQNDTARPEMRFSQAPTQKPAPKSNFYQSMTAADYRAFAEALKEKTPAVKPEVAKAILTPQEKPKNQPLPQWKPAESPKVAENIELPFLPPVDTPKAAETVPVSIPVIPKAEPAPVEPEQQRIELPGQDWTFIGEVLNTYLIVQEGETVLFIDKHAAHERILFEKFRAQTAPIMPQVLMSPISAHFDRQDAAMLLEHAEELAELGYELDDFGDDTILIRSIPSDIDVSDAVQTLEELCTDLSEGKAADGQALRDTMLHTVACKAAIKAGWRTGKEEQLSLCREVLTRDDIRYCPHGRPVCISLTKSQLERQFKRS